MKLSLQIQEATSKVNALSALNNYIESNMDDLAKTYAELSVVCNYAKFDLSDNYRAEFYLEQEEYSGSCELSMYIIYDD